MIQAILNYQQIDQKLYKLERELASCDERKEYVKLKKYMENAEEKLDSLETKAAALKAEAIELSKHYLSAEETLKEFEHLDELIAGGADIAFYKKKAQAIMDQMRKIRADMTALTKNIEETSAEYQDLKAKVIENQKKYVEAKAKYKDAKDARADEKAAIEADLAEAAKGVDEGLLNLYLTKRKEKLFPVVGQLNDKRCPFCSMDVPIASQSALSGGGTIECEHCHHIIYQ
ncbi:MAG: hypothetical protein IKC37_00350 [Clostridia bacterium]|nr:hypothetical protein [Clostridia bacterium]